MGIKGAVVSMSAAEGRGPMGAEGRVVGTGAAAVNVCAAKSHGSTGVKEAVINREGGGEPWINGRQEHCRQPLATLCVALASLGRYSANTSLETVLSAATNFSAKPTPAMSRTLASKRELESHTGLDAELLEEGQLGGIGLGALLDEGVF